VHSLVTLLEHLPLALVQAAAYIHKTSITIHKYIDLYNKDEGTQMRLLQTDFSDLERDQNAENAVLKTWVLSFEQVKLEDPKAANLLSIMSCLDAKSIPESMLQVEIPDSLDFVNALATLKAFALVTTSENGETFDVHRMVQLSMQRWLETRQESSSWANRALLILETAYYMLQTDGVNDKFAEYYPHTIAALAIKSKPTKESRWSRAALWYKAGVTLCRDYQNAKAHEKFMTAIRLWTDLLGDANFVTLASIMMAAKNLQVLAQRDGFGMQEAEAMLLRASNGFEIAAGPQARETMTAKVCLAELYTESEEWTKAKEILTSILRQSEDTSDCREELFEVIVDAKSAMVHIYQLEGKFRAAETLQLGVVAFSEHAFTRENFRTRAAIRRLAEIQSELGQHDNAINLLQEVLSLNQRLCGEAHVATFGIIQSLAEVYRKLKRYEESLRILEEFLPLVQEDLYHGISLRVSVIEHIAVSLQYLNRYDEEVQMREQSLAIQRKRQGFDHVRTIQSTLLTADCHRRLKRYEEEFELLKGVVPTMKRVIGDEHPSTLRSMFGLAMAHLKVNQIEVGLALCQEVFLMSQRILGDDHVDTQAIRNALEELSSTPPSSAWSDDERKLSF